MPSIVLLSGPIASGKTTLADELIKRHGFLRLKSSDHLKIICAERGLEVSRANLQEVGDDLDGLTDYQWLVSDVAKPQMAAASSQTRWLVDAVRKERQVEHFKAEFGQDVLHVHISAPEEVLRARYDKRREAGGDHEGSTDYLEALEHPNEIASRALTEVADINVDLTQIDPVEAAARIVERLTKGS